MTNVELWKYIIDGNCDYFTLFLSEVHPLLQMGLRNPTKHNRVKSSMYAKHGNNETLRFLEESITALAIQTSKTKIITLPSRIQGVLSLSLVVTTGKTSTVKDLNIPQTVKLFCKSKVFSGKYSKPKSSINPPFRLGGYVYLSLSCLMLFEGG